MERKTKSNGTNTILKTNVKNKQKENKKLMVLKLDKAKKENKEKKKEDKRVKWDQNVVDNEHMGRLKSNSKNFFLLDSLLYLSSY